MSRRFLLIGLAVLTSVASAQSPRPDIEWMSGGHIPSIQTATYSPDGSLIGSSGYFDESGIKLWRASDGAMIRTLPGSGANPFIFGPMMPVTFFPDGKTIVALGEASAIGFWNTASGKLIRIANVMGRHLAISPDGTKIAVGTDANVVKILQASDGSLIRTLTGPTDIPEKVAFSPDGTIVAAGDRDGFLRTWRVSDGAPLLAFQAHIAYTQGVSFSPNGALIATGGADKLAKTWNATTGALVQTFTGHTDWLNDVAFSPDGQKIATTSWDNSARLWDVTSGASLKVFLLPDSGFSVAFNPSNTRLLVACDQAINEYDLATLTLIRNLVGNTQPITGTQFTSDGAHVVVTSYDGTVSVRKTVDGSLERRERPGFGQNSLAISPDDSLIACGCLDQTVKLLRFSDLALVGTLSPGTYTYSIAFSPNGATIATGHLGGAVRLWDSTTHALINTLSDHTDQVNGLAYTSDGAMLLSASEDGTVRVWTAAGAFVRSLQAPGEQFSSVVISPDNQLAMAGTYTGKVFLWNIATGALVYSFQAHTQSKVNEVCFTTNGSAFYTAGSNSQLKVWRLSDHLLLETYTKETGGVAASSPGPNSIDISSDGKWLVYGRDDATVTLARNALLAAPTSLNIVRGTLIQGTFADLQLSDDVSMLIQSSPSVRDLPVEVDIFSQLKIASPSSLSFIIETGASAPTLQRQVWMKNFQTGQLELVDTSAQTPGESSSRITINGNFARFIGPNREVQARVKWGPASRTGWQIRIDQVLWSAGL